MEDNEKSSVWLVSLESHLDSNKEGKYTKQKLFDYPDDKSSILFPIGYVIKHPSDWDSSYKSYDGFSKRVNLISYPIYSGTTLSHLEGELLTIADSAFTDKQQREAFKSLIRTTLWKFNSYQEERVEEVFKAS